ncbi:ABC transporter substrate-binding protein [Oceanotoga sp. DSM 15011]|uniref:Peptide/nickel transport system substrate-binding protein n=1 Tax=Oceanotoga teriensis TaxID=515440 RepID=A0AA45C4Y3_9BACT|nr:MULTISPECIES: ABC transporter substrate-binding protein [Oceanotoga]MDO7976597.1 ABC transporter substrate-binding protein [Oceanotoga teriensis]PWJ87682.1 peptide/nickel transport system substrate-binding protein [Oceanotoga teriensis]UYO99314.1 ABC transporter substrate-binding protein [Oceanotoga sp. DSM 15011]
MKKVLIVCLILTMALLAFSKDFVVDEMFTKQEPKMGGEINLALPGSPQSFNLYGSLDSHMYTVMLQILNPLVDMNNITKEVEPALAESWEVSPDGKEVIFHLRDVKWSDGHPFDADDVMFTLKYFAMNNKAENNARGRFTFGGKLVEWEKIDDMTIKAILPEPFGAFFITLTHVKIFPQHVLEPLVDKNALSSVNKIWTTDTPVEKIVGTGPFTMEQYTPDQKFVLKKNPYYWKVDKWGNRLPYIDKLNFLIIADPEVRMAKFMSEEVDYTVLNPRDYPTLKYKELQGAPYRIFKAEPINPVPSPLHITFNLDTTNADLKELFLNEDFRHAMEYALDRERIIEDVYNMLAVKGGTPTLPSNSFYNPKIEDIRRSFDLTKASKILDELGLKDTDNDGIRNLKNGKNLEIVFLTKTDQDYQEVAYLYSQDLKKIGVKLHLQLLDGNIALEKATAGNFEMAMLAFGNQPDPQLRKEIWQPGNPLYYNHTSTFDKQNKKAIKENMYDWELRVYDLFDLGQSTMDQSKRREYYNEWQEIYADKIPYIFVCKGMTLMGWNERVGNVYQLKQDGPVIFTNWTIFVK